MIVEPDFLTHWKTQMLIAELDDKAAPLYVIALWAHCQLRRSDTFHNVAPNALKAICRYEGEASRLRSALERCGFLEVRGEAVVVHEWAATNAKLVANWENGQKGGRPKKPNDNPPETQLEIGLTQQEPIEKRREEKKEITPKSPSGTSISFERWWSVYPRYRRANKATAYKRYQAAGKLLVERGKSRDEAIAFLLSRVEAFADSWLGKSQYAPAADVWLNKGRYDDDPAAWENPEKRTQQTEPIKYRN